MTSSPGTNFREPAAPRLYRILRGLVRLGLEFRFRRVRLLGDEPLADFRAALLVVGRPPSFEEALIMVAAFRRRVRCVLSGHSTEGFAQKLLARSLGMIANRPSMTYAASQALAQNEAVVVFSEKEATNASGGITSAATATLALEAASDNLPSPGVTIFPVHLFVPHPRSLSHEVLIHLQAPLIPQKELAAKGEASRDRARELAKLLEGRLGERVFSVPPSEFEQLLEDLEEVLRYDLERDWASRPNWKQKVEGFELSRFVVAWAERLNEVNPERLVAVCECSRAYREIRRLGSLDQFGLEALRVGSIWRRWRIPLLALRASRRAKKLERSRSKLLEQLHRNIQAYALPSGVLPDARGSGRAGIPGTRHA